MEENPYEVHTLKGDVSQAIADIRAGFYPLYLHCDERAWFYEALADAYGKMLDCVNTLEALSETLEREERDKWLAFQM